MVRDKTETRISMRFCLFGRWLVFVEKSRKNIGRLLAHRGYVEVVDGFRTRKKKEPSPQQV
jgi:hypothetical protein